MIVKTPKMHTSHQIHQRQFWLQIVFPVVLSGLVIAVITVLTGMAAFGETGDVSRWAAISTIWLVLPLLATGLFFLLILLSVIYILARLLKIIPPYTIKARRYINLWSQKTIRISNITVKPIFLIQDITARLRSLIKRH